MLMQQRDIFYGLVQKGGIVGAKSIGVPTIAVCKIGPSSGSATTAGIAAGKSTKVPALSNNPQQGRVC